MKQLAALAALLSCAWVQVAGGRAGVHHQPEDGLALQISAAGTLAVARLRFSGCPSRSLRAVLLPDSDGLQAAMADQQLAAASPLDFQRTYDRSSDSWTLNMTLPAAYSRPALLQLWCRACRQAGRSQILTGLVVSQPVADGEAGTLVLVLDGALLPAASGLKSAAGSAATVAASSSRRRLQQAANCAMTVAGKAYTFASCTQPDVGVNMGGSASFAFTVYSTVTASGSGSVLQMGMVAKAGGGWAGWALPKSPGIMLGANAVIMYPTATGAEVAGYMLPDSSYDASAINAAKGSFPITQASAENVGGELRAVFTIAMPSKSAAAMASTDYIYALGPLSGGTTSSPKLQDHTLGGYPYSSGVFAMKQAASPPPTTAAATPTPATEQPSGAGAGSVPATAAPSPSPSPAAAAAAPAPSPAAAADSGCSLLLSESGVAVEFPSCKAVKNVGTDFFIMWKTEPMPSNPAKLLLTMGMNATPSGYVAVGFPSTPGQMSKATAMVLQACTAGTAGCTNGAQLGEWYMASTRSQDVNPSTNVATSGVQAAALPSTGQLAGMFQIEVDAPTTAARRRRRLMLLESSDGTMPLIFAAGNLLPNGGLQQHYDDGDAVLPLASPSTSSSAADASGEGDSSGDGGGENSSLKAAHAWLTAIGWGVFIPTGVVMARSFKDAAPLWFHLHRGLQSLGFIMGTIGMGLGFQLVEGQWATEDSYHTVHRNLGVACTVLGFTQLSALVLRPKKGEKYRYAWELWHSWVGRSATVIAIANIYYGILHMWELGVWTWASYTAVLCSIVAVSVVKDTSDFIKSLKPKVPRRVEAVQLSHTSPKAANGAAFGAQNGISNGTAAPYDRPV